MTDSLEFTTSVDIEVVCALCGKDLGTTVTSDRFGDKTIKVEVCEGCFQRAENDGYEKGQQDA